jgi:ribosomal protein S8
MNSHLKDLREMVSLIRLGYSRHHSEVVMKHTSLRSKMVASVLMLRHREGFIKYYPQLMLNTSADLYDTLHSTPKNHGDEGLNVGQQGRHVTVWGSDDDQVARPYSVEQNLHKVEWLKQEEKSLAKEEAEMKRRWGELQKAKLMTHNFEAGLKAVASEAVLGKDHKGLLDPHSALKAKRKSFIQRRHALRKAKFDYENLVSVRLQAPHTQAVSEQNGAVVQLKYVNGVPAVKKLILDPNGGTWVSVRDLHAANSGFETWIISTKFGVMDHEEARGRKVGGLRLLIVS